MTTNIPIDGLNEVQDALALMIDDAVTQAGYQDECCDGYAADVLGACESIRRDVAAGLHTCGAPTSRAADLAVALALRTEKHQTVTRLRWAFVRSLDADQLHQLLVGLLAENPAPLNRDLTDYEQTVVDRIATRYEANPLAVADAARFNADKLRRDRAEADLERTNR